MTTTATSPPAPRAAVGRSRSLAPKIYHIAHVDRLASIVADGFLWCDTELQQRVRPGTIIGMTEIKQRRLTNSLTSHPGLFVGDCVPFYFCPRSVMLYVIHMANHRELAYRGGQRPIVHLEADLCETVAWADQQERRWAFTLSNAGARYFEDRCHLACLEEINWEAVQTNRWSGGSISPAVKEDKQAEFLVEQSFPWELVGRIGMYSQEIFEQVKASLRRTAHQPQFEIKKQWCY